MKRFILDRRARRGKDRDPRQLELEGFQRRGRGRHRRNCVVAGAGHRRALARSHFIDAIVDLQTQREVRSARQLEAVQFHDRSVVCTAALATYLGFPFGSLLEHALERITRESTFQKEVFFIRNLGFIAPTEARRISFEEALRFERIHEDVYRQCGFELISIEAASLAAGSRRSRELSRRNETASADRIFRTEHFHRNSWDSLVLVRSCASLPMLFVRRGKERQLGPISLFVLLVH